MTETAEYTLTLKLIGQDDDQGGGTWFCHFSGPDVNWRIPIAKNDGTKAIIGQTWTDGLRVPVTKEIACKLARLTA